MTSQETILFIICNTKDALDKAKEQARRLSYIVEQTSINMDVIQAHMWNFERTFKSIEENTFNIAYGERIICSLDDTLNNVFSKLFGGCTLVENDYPSPDMMVKAHMEEIYSDLQNELTKIYCFAYNEADLVVA